MLSVGGQTSTPLDDASVLSRCLQCSGHPIRASAKPLLPNQKLSQGAGAYSVNGHLCICRFQLVGIACLRAAMGDVHRKRGSHDERLTRNLAPDRFAYISDSTYTEAQVVDMTATIQDCTTDDLRTSPNSKMFLRSFWYRLVQASAVSSEEMHIYTLSRYFCHQPNFTCRLSLLSFGDGLSRIKEVFKFRYYCPELCRGPSSALLLECASVMACLAQNKT